jgi:hypothetical protein
MDIGQLNSRRRELVIPVDEGEIRLGYQPRRNSLKLQMEMLQEGADPKSLVRLLMALGLEWDLTDGGAPYPVNEENLLNLDATLLLAFVQAINEDQRPNLTSGETTAKP